MSDIEKAVCEKLRQIRTGLKMTLAEVDSRLGVGPGWIAALENGEVGLSIEMLAPIMSIYNTSFSDVFELDGISIPSQLKRAVFGVQSGEGVWAHFPYGKHDARFLIKGATVDEFDDVISVLRDTLAQTVIADEDALETVKTEAVASSFFKAIEYWPNVNPSDIWYLLVYRAYCDPFNHPAKFSRLDFGQSWKRTGGWALEKVLVKHYADFLLRRGIRLFIADGDEKHKYIAQLRTKDRLEADKADVFLSGEVKGREICFGVIHVKASFAERRTDDVPMSKALVDAGFFSPLWTMDCKATPSASPRNRGELGNTKDGNFDKRSAKRKDIEDDGYFSACYTYNDNTLETPAAQNSAAKIMKCNFNRKDDAFTRDILNFWSSFKSNWEPTT